MPTRGAIDTRTLYTRHVHTSRLSLQLVTFARRDTDHCTCMQRGRCYTVTSGELDPMSSKVMSGRWGVRNWTHGGGGQRRNADRC